MQKMKKHEMKRKIKDILFYARLPKFKSGSYNGLRISLSEATNQLYKLFSSVQHA